jgi:hypothetical protein
VGQSSPGEASTHSERKDRSMSRRGLLIVGVFGTVLLGWYAKHSVDRARIERDWIHLKGFSGAVEHGSVKSMKPVKLSVWRYRSDNRPETTYEHLDFAIPAAYMIDKANLSGGAQKSIHLYLHAPTGDPVAFHKRPEVYDMHSVGWPIQEYILEIGSGGEVPLINMTGEQRARLFSNILHIGSGRENPYTGMYCSWYSFDEKNSGNNTLEHQNPKAGITSEIYLDSKIPAEWRRMIECGPDMRVCTLRTSYQRFPLKINFSPLNICKARQFEDQARRLLDSFLVAHHPPTRMWGHYVDPHSPSHALDTYSNSDEWTRTNLNNGNIRNAAK